MEKYQENVLDSQRDVTKTKHFILLELLAWALILLAIFSCLWRNDCNVLMGLIIIITLFFIIFYHSNFLRFLYDKLSFFLVFRLTLIILKKFLTLNRKLKVNPGTYSKVIIHILVGVILIDLIWMFIMFSYWNDSENEKLYTGKANILHGWVEFLGVLELLIKGAMVFFVFIIYKNFNNEGLKGLLNFKYN